MKLILKNINGVDKNVKDEVNVKMDGIVDWGVKYGFVMKVGDVVGWGVGKGTDDEIYWVWDI